MNTRSRRVRRSLAVPTALLMVAGALAGCGSDDGGVAAAPDVSASASVSGDGSTAVSPAPRAETSEQAPAPDGTELGYEGEDGKTALELLVQHDPTAKVRGEGESAFVTAIGGREADESKNEFWAFYVNGEAAQVGAGSYETRSGDEILWKLETFR